MHIIIGLLTTLVTVLFLLDRLGIDIGGLNPFAWRRRRAWAEKYKGDPIYSVEDPVHVAALMSIGVAKLEGDISAEQKKVALKHFESSFSMSSNEAMQLFGSATHLLGAPQIVDKQLKGLTERNTDRFSWDQASSVLEMMTAIAAAGGGLTGAQEQYIEEFRSQFVPEKEEPGTWG